MGQRETRRIVVGPGASEPIRRDRRLEGFGGTVEIVVSDGPEVDLRSAIEDLVDYPYGCGEQIGSRIEGLLAALLVDPAVGGAPPESIRSMIEAGLGRLWESQANDGRIPYWSGGKGDDAQWLVQKPAERSSEWMSASRHIVQLAAKKSENARGIDAETLVSSLALTVGRYHTDQGDT